MLSYIYRPENQKKNCVLWKKMWKATKGTKCDLKKKEKKKKKIAEWGCHFFFGAFGALNLKKMMSPSSTM